MYPRYIQCSGWTVIDHSDQCNDRFSGDQITGYLSVVMMLVLCN